MFLISYAMSLLTIRSARQPVPSHNPRCTDEPVDVDLGRGTADRVRLLHPVHQ